MEQIIRSFGILPSTEAVTRLVAADALQESDAPGAELLAEVLRTEPEVLLTRPKSGSGSGSGSGDGSGYGDGSGDGDGDGSGSGDGYGYGDGSGDG